MSPATHLATESSRAQVWNPCRRLQCKQSRMHLVQLPGTASPLPDWYQRTFHQTQCSQIWKSEIQMFSAKCWYFICCCTLTDAQRSYSCKSWIAFSRADFADLYHVAWRWRHCSGWCPTQVVQYSAFFPPVAQWDFSRWAAATCSIQRGEYFAKMHHICAPEGSSQSVAGLVRWNNITTYRPWILQ